MLECVVEGVRAGIQPGFHTWDYTTKPGMTCGPVLKHMSHMAQLEARLEQEAAARQAAAVLETFPYQKAPFNLPDKGEEPLQGHFTPEQRGSRRRLCHLWTAANQAVMKGFCLTGRHVIRARSFWRLMMKRVVWGFLEAARSCRAQQEQRQPGGIDPGFDTLYLTLRKRCACHEICA